jgi:hypothetical protein
MSDAEHIVFGTGWVERLDGQPMTAEEKRAAMSRMDRALAKSFEQTVTATKRTAEQ